VDVGGDPVAADSEPQQSKVVEACLTRVLPCATMSRGLTIVRTIGADSAQVHLVAQPRRNGLVVAWASVRRLPESQALAEG
jgi:hypothetical protein